MNPYRHIHIFGASGSGATTLGRALGERLSYTVLDGDDYFWARKFDEARPPEERVKMLEADLERHDPWILSGAICGWGDAFKSEFDLVIFLYVPAAERLDRLKTREYRRYGEQVLPGGQMHEESIAFLDWAALYDHAGEEVRSLKLHERWMEDLQCPVLKIEGVHSVEERIEIVRRHMHHT